MRGLHPNRTRGRKARREGGGYQDNPRTRSLFKACLNTTRTLTECPVLQNAFLLDAKRNKSGKGLFSESAPCNPKTPHTPTNGMRERGKCPPPYLRGQNGTANKREKEMGTSARQKTRRKQKHESAVLQLRRGAGYRSARVLILIHRRCQGREKFCRQRLANFFGAVP